MQEIGLMLKEEREAKGLSLQDVQRLSRISLHYLEALEAGDFAAIPGEVYVRGFLRRYAESLGIDPNLVIERYLRNAREAEEAAALRDATRVSPATRPSRAGATVAAGVVIVVLLAGGALLARSLFYPKSTARRNSVQRELPSAPEVRTPETPLATEAAPPVEEAEGQPEQAPGSPTALGATSVAPGTVGTDGLRARPVDIQVKLVEGCWLEVISDGRLLLRETRPAGETVSFSADEQLRVRFGNPRGVQVRWNGRDVSLPETDPTTRLFTRDAATSVAPPPKAVVPRPVQPNRSSQSPQSVAPAAPAGSPTVVTPASTTPPGGGPSSGTGSGSGSAVGTPPGTTN